MDYPQIWLGYFRLTFKWLRELIQFYPPLKNVSKGNKTNQIP